MKRTIILAAGVFIFGAAAVNLFSQKIETVNGTRVVHNEKGGKFGKDAPIALKLIRNIGDVDTADENLAFNYPSDIVMDTAGNIYILDSANNRIQKFDPNGKFLETIGRKGQGPGEFYNPDSFDVDAKGNFWIMDSYQNRIQTLTPDGKGDRTIPLLDRFLRRLRLMKSGLLAVQAPLLYTSFGEKTGLPKLIKLLDREGKVQNELGDIFDFGDPVTNSMGNSIYFDLDGNDNIVVSFRAQNRVEKYLPDGKLLWKADRPLNYGMEVKKKGKSEIKVSGGSRGGTITPPQMNICCLGVAADAKGRSWIVTYDRQLKDEEKVQTSMTTVTGTGGVSVSRKTTGNTELRSTNTFKLEVFDPDGVLLGEVPLTHFVDAIRICGDNLFLLDRDRGVTFYQYKIIEK
jgi:sugar lactone lactonase YvrE